MATILSAVEGQVIDFVPIKRCLVSVSDKTGIVELCTVLQQKYQVELLSTGGTAKKLRESGLTVMDVSDYTGGAECLDGRVKTLHPKIHGGLLAVRGNDSHSADMTAQAMSYIDMTILNLYPFEETMKKEGVTFAQCVENIDIGGPSMMRSTAKNHVSTTIVTSPSQYDSLLEELDSTRGATTLKTRKSYAAQAFALSASYDSMIASYFASELLKEEEIASTTTTTVATVATPTLSQVVVPRIYQPEFLVNDMATKCDSVVSCTTKWKDTVRIGTADRSSPNKKHSRLLVTTTNKSSTSFSTSNPSSPSSIPTKRQKKCCCVEWCGANDTQLKCVPKFPKPLDDDNASDNRRRTHAKKAFIRREYLERLGLQRFSKENESNDLRYCTTHVVEQITKSIQVRLLDGTTELCSHTFLAPVQIKKKMPT